MRLNYDCVSEKTNRIYWQIHYVIRWSFIKKFIYNIYIYKYQYLETMLKT